MPLVFVHGVSNRMNAAYKRGVRNRDALFRSFLLAPHGDGDNDIAIANPYWGDLGGSLAWEGASIPMGEFEALGAQDAAYVALHASLAGDATLVDLDTTVLTVARDQSLQQAVDLLWASAAMLDDENAQVLASSAQSAVRYAEANPNPAWLDEVQDDRALLDRLHDEIEGGQGGTADRPAGDEEWESLGLSVGAAWNALRQGIDRLKTGIASSVGRAAADRIRPAVLPPLSMFLGDVLQYLHQQQSDDAAIRNRVGESIQEAAATRTDDDPLVIVAHSMGGNITYDLLTSSLADLQVDVYVTVGTQIGLFEELKLFVGSDASVPGDDPNRLVTRPANVGRWLNIFDRSDFLGFQIGTVIDGAEDFAYKTGSLLHAHGQYFVQPGFHRRLARRVHGDD